MTETGPESPSPPVEAASSDDHAYFRALEEAFLKLRGKSTLLAAADWQTAQGWHRAGIPVELVIRVMEELFARARERKRRNISALRYFKAAVEAAWIEVESLSAGGRKERLEPLRIEDRLRRLAAALPDELAERTRWSTSIEALRGEVEEVEAALTLLDRALLDDLTRSLAPAAESELEATIERALDGLRERLPAAERDRVHRHLRGQLVRKRFGVPVLSLFSPQAREPTDADAS